MPALAEAQADPFADLVPDVPVESSEPVGQSSTGIFYDLVPSSPPPTPDPVRAFTKGVFDDLIPTATEVELALQETPLFDDPKLTAVDRFVGGAINKARNLGIEVLSEFSPAMSAQVFGQTSGGLREEEKSKPLISPENAKAFVGELPVWAGGNTELGKGLAEGTAGALSSFSNPAALGQLPAFAAPGIAETYVLNVLHDLPDQGRRIWEAIQQYGLNSKEVGNLAAEYGITDLTAFFAAKSGTAERFRTTQRDINAAPTSPASASETVPPTEPPPLPDVPDAAARSGIPTVPRTPEATAESPYEPAPANNRAPNIEDTAPTAEIAQPEIIPPEPPVQPERWQTPTDIEPGTTAAISELNRQLGPKEAAPAPEILQASQEGSMPDNLRRSQEIDRLIEPVDEQGPKLKLKADKEGGFVNADIFKEAVDFGARIYQKGMDFAKWSADMVRHLGEKVGSHLKAIWDSFIGKDFLPGSTEGGALFSGGGKTKAKGVTPKGDTEFLKIEPGWKRAVKGLERKGAADVIGETRNKVGKLLSEATKKHVDLEQEMFGQLSGELLRATKGVSKREVTKGFDEVTTYLAAKENGRPLPARSPTATKLVTAWENIADRTGQISAANNVQVFDPVLGKHRSMHVMGKNYVPRMLKPEVERVMRDPETNPRLWNALVDDFATSRGITDIEAAKELRSQSSRFSQNDFMGNLEMARTGKLPESFYDYDLRNLASHYIPNFSERMAQIIAYGQRLGPREAPLRPNLWDVARQESANTYTQDWLTSAENQAINLKSKGAAATGMARAQTAASGLLLSSPTTTVMRNLISGVSATPEIFGLRRSFKQIFKTVRNAQAKMDAKEIGAVRENIGDHLHAERLGDSPIDNAIRSVVDAGLKYSGYNGSEVFVRTHGMLTASQFVKDGVSAIVKNPKSMRAKEALGLFKRTGANAAKIVAEGGDWRTGPETRKFIRTSIRDTQGGYRFDQVPLWANSNMGRFFYQFGRWGTQRSRNIWQNGIKPALGETVEWNGKKMNRRDIRPLAKMLVGTVILGETFAGISQVLFGRDRRDASVEEIVNAWKEDEMKGVSLALQRAVNDVIMAGTLGIWSQPIDWGKGLKDQSRLKNPTEPPGLSSIGALMDLGQKFLDQGTLTKRDLLEFARTFTPGAKQLSDVARNVLDEPLYEAENDVKTLRSAARRWGEQSGLDVSPRARGDFRKSALAPEYEPIKEALLVGDAQTARFLAKKFLDGQPDKKKAELSLKASIRQSQPFRAGPYSAKVHLSNFRKWAKANLPAEDYQQTERIQARYVKAAEKASLWGKSDDSE